MRTSPTPIVDKNGKHTTVHKNIDAESQNDKRVRDATKSLKPKASSEQARDVMFDISNRTQRATSNKAQVISRDEIIIGLIGHNPTTGKAEVAFGGKTKSGYYGEHISVSSVDKALSELIDDGVIVRVSDDGKRRVNAADFFSLKEGEKYEALLRTSLSFPYRVKVGYVFADELDEALAASRQHIHSARIDQLRKEAEEEVAKRHLPEVESRLAELRAQEGI